MFTKLHGYKTYILAFSTTIGAIAGYVVGDASLHDSLQLIITALLGATLRHGIAAK